MNEREFVELSAGYALGALSPEDLAAFETALAEHPEWQSLVDADAATAAALGDAVAEVAPPLTMRSTLLSRIATPAVDPATAETEEEAAEKPSPAVDPAPTTTTLQAVSRRNWTRGLLALAASMVLLFTLGFGAAWIQAWTARTPAEIALQDIEGAPDAQTASGETEEGGSVILHWSPSLEKAVVVTDGLPTVASGETFELWLIGEDGVPVSAGVFDEVEEGPTTTIVDGEMAAGDTVAITVEPAGGAPDGVPTSDPIVAIPTA